MSNGGFKLKKHEMKWTRWEWPILLWLLPNFQVQFSHLAQTRHDKFYYVQIILEFMRPCMHSFGYIGKLSECRLDQSLWFILKKIMAIFTSCILLWSHKSVVFSSLLMRLVEKLPEHYNSYRNGLPLRHYQIGSLCIIRWGSEGRRIDGSGLHRRFKQSPTLTLRDWLT